MNAIGSLVGGGGSTQIVQPAPVNPAFDPDAEKKRMAAQQEVLRRQAQAGRAGDQGAGYDQTLADQMNRGLFKSTQRRDAVARNMQLG